jgi:hypothetical protein
MPRSWYVNRPLWYFLIVASFGAGYVLLRDRRAPADEWRPSRAGRRFETVVVYTREGCHLCDHAKDVLLKYRRYLPEIEEVDIGEEKKSTGGASPEDPCHAYADCIPVVEIDGKVRFRGRIDELPLRRLIEGAPPRSLE